MTRSLTAFACLTMVTVILLQICLFKAYKTVFQRMFLYLIISAWILQALLSMCIEHQFHYEGQQQLCKVYGFLTQWSVSSMFLFSLGIIIHLLYVVFSKIKGKSSTCTSEKGLFYRSLEPFYIVAVCIVPVTYLWIPFLHDNYGLAGAFCWMRALDDNCTNVGLGDQVVFGYGFSIITGIVGAFATIVLSVLYCRISQRFPEAKKILLRTLILAFFLLAFILVISLALAVRLYTAITGRHQTYSVWIMHGVAIPVCHIIFPIGYLICFYSWTWFRWTTLKKAAMKNWKCCFACCKGAKMVRANLKNKGAESTVDVCTHPESSRVSDLSHTYFNVPYTNEFTQIESEAELLQSQMNGNDVQYGSVLNT